MLFLLIAFLTYTLTSLLGYLIHLAFHQPWAGKFYHAHNNHHQKQYPPNDLISTTYRSAGGDDTTWLFLIAFSPLLLLLGIGMITGFVPLTYGLMILAIMSIVGLLNSFIHDSFHLISSWWSLFPGYKELREQHYLHHRQTDRNFGIYSFTWDKLFGTYQDK